MGLVNKSETQLVNLEKTSSKNKISEAAEVSWFNLQVTQDKKKRIIMTFDNADGVQFETLLENNSRKPVIGFDHAKIIHYGLTRLRNKIEWTNIAFSMLPKEFTLAELQQVYELILDKKFTKANFQRKVKDNLQALAKYKVGGFRPAEFYSYKAK
jgi:ADP-ribose pyrophosphatase YjhB (NUDIX family)